MLSGLALVGLPWVFFLAIRLYIELVGPEAVESMTRITVFLYFLVVLPVGFGLLVASFFTAIRKHLSKGS